MPTGINLPIITFSFKPLKLSTLPDTAASIKIFAVSWNEAADKKEEVDKYAGDIDIYKTKEGAKKDE